MSSNDEVGGVAREATPAVVVDGQNTIIGHQPEDKSAVPASALDKMLAMIGDLSERMCRLESLQSGQVDLQQHTSAESSIFGSAL